MTEDLKVLMEILKELKKNTFAVEQLMELFKGYDTEEFLNDENLREG